jgi:hypothetical protein
VDPQSTDASTVRRSATSPLQCELRQPKPPRSRKHVPTHMLRQLRMHTAQSRVHFRWADAVATHQQCWIPGPPSLPNAKPASQPALVEAIDRRCRIKCSRGRVVQRHYSKHSSCSAHRSSG